MMMTTDVRPDPDFGEAFARSLATFLDAMNFQEPVEVAGGRITVPVSNDLVVYLDVRAMRRAPVLRRLPRRRRHLTLVESVEGEAG